MRIRRKSSEFFPRPGGATVSSSPSRPVSLLPLSRLPSPTHVSCCTTEPQRSRRPCTPPTTRVPVANSFCSPRSLSSRNRIANREPMREHAERTCSRWRISETRVHRATTTTTTAAGTNVRFLRAHEYKRVFTEIYTHCRPSRARCVREEG